MTAATGLRPSTPADRRPERVISPAPPGRGGWLRRLLPFLWAHRAKVLVAFGAALAGQLIAGLTPVAEKIITDDVILTHRRSLTPWLVALVAAGVARFGTAYVRRFFGGRVALDVQYDLRNAIYDRLQRLDFARLQVDMRRKQGTVIGQRRMYQLSMDAVEYTEQCHHL